jgi:hypothetical protein
MREFFRALRMRRCSEFERRNQEDPMSQHIIRSVVAVALLTVFAAGSASAQSSGTFAVPFEFQAGRHTLAAGTYTVREISPRLMQVRSDDGRTNVVVEAPLAARAAKRNATAKLTFRRYGDHYFLAQVWTSPDAGRELYVSDAERSLVEERETVATIEVKSR